MIETTAHAQLDLFQQRRKTLLALIQRQLELLDSLDMKGWQETLHRVEKRLQVDSFKVLILGESKGGNSTFINAMLGDKVLPAYAKPCAAIINEVKWGERKRALLHYTNSPDNGAKLVKEIPIDKIEEYVVIKDKISELKENPYEKLELFCPLEICRNGVEIIDFPGLNFREIRQKATRDYISTVDAVLFVLSSGFLSSQRELNFMDNSLLSMGHKDIFFVCNQINQIRAKERESIKEYAFSKLVSPTKRGKKSIFFIDALGALEGRLELDEVRLNQSGVPELEKELATFLTNQKGRLKILQADQEFKGAIREAQRIIPERATLLITGVKTLERRFETAQKTLNLLELERQQIVIRLSNFIKDTQPFIHQKIQQFLDVITETKIAEWMTEYELEEPFRFLKLECLTTQIEKVVEEVKNHLAQRIETEFFTWQFSELQPFLTARLESLMRELEKRAEVFVKNIENLRVDLIVGTSTSQNVITYQETKVSLLERVIAASGGFSLSDSVAGVLGTAFDFQKMVKGLIAQTVLFAVTSAFADLNPFILIPAMLIGGIVQGDWKNESTNDEIKKAVTEKFINQICTDTYQRSNELSNAIVQKISKIKDAIDQEFCQEIQNIRDQVDSILKEKQKGQSNVEQKLYELVTIRKILDAIDSELNELITQVATM
ncbi:dynamin family protein (plasmid) [Cylindrospermum stagnale PCC 7417]|uniref:Dynamin family protein n=1 Tax=Cylindrospermum stagnale PCC 7417 TaxID=56107 RepID=K9X8G2_9NOST|nr:dynamin family protein [Cylindrospermum stagnale]AFZ28394.1 dynamin family protein [Cylindrospermum stagnale PCC 7417]